jgi:hypothetical protein
MSEVKEVEELAKELWSIFDDTDDEKWTNLVPEHKEHYLMRARHLLSMGYRRPASGSPLPVELDERELFNIINNQTFDLTKQGNCLGHENSWALAKAICSRFSQKKVTNLEGKTK